MPFCSRFLFPPQNVLLAVRKAFDAFFLHYPYCYGYWKKYADIEKKHDNIQVAEEVNMRNNIVTILTDIAVLKWFTISGNNLIDFSRIIFIFTEKSIMVLLRSVPCFLRPTFSGKMCRAT